MHPDTLRLRAEMSVATRAPTVWRCPNRRQAVRHGPTIQRAPRTDSHAAIDPLDDFADQTGAYFG